MIEVFITFNTHAPQSLYEVLTTKSIKCNLRIEVERIEVENNENEIFNFLCKTATN